VTQPKTAAIANTPAARRTVSSRPLERAESVGGSPPRRTVEAFSRITDVLYGRCTVAAHRMIHIAADGLIVEAAVIRPNVFGTVDLCRVPGASKNTGDDRS